jgi:anti-sigma B factor antagonist
MKVIQSDESLLKIAFSGRLDSNYISNNDVRFFALLNGLEAPVVLDFSEVSFLGSLGIRMILMALKDVKRQGYTLKIEHAGSNVKDVFEMTSLGDLLI